jgi:hypothetical protein
VRLWTRVSLTVGGAVGGAVGGCITKAIIKIDADVITSKKIIETVLFLNGR